MRDGLLLHFFLWWDWGWGKNERKKGGRGKKTLLYNQPLTKNMFAPTIHNFSNYWLGGIIVFGAGGEVFIRALQACLQSCLYPYIFYIRTLDPNLNPFRIQHTTCTNNIFFLCHDIWQEIQCSVFSLHIKWSTHTCSHGHMK